jgi:hypothetical protein
VSDLWCWERFLRKNEVKNDFTGQWPLGETKEKLRLTVTFQEQRGWNFRDKMRLKVTSFAMEPWKKCGILGKTESESNLRGRKCELKKWVRPPLRLKQRLTVTSDNQVRSNNMGMTMSRVTSGIMRTKLLFTQRTWSLRLHCFWVESDLYGTMEHSWRSLKATARWWFSNTLSSLYIRASSVGQYAR